MSTKPSYLDCRFVENCKTYDCDNCLHNPDRMSAPVNDDIAIDKAIDHAMRGEYLEGVTWALIAIAKTLRGDRHA